MFTVYQKSLSEKGSIGVILMMGFATSGLVATSVPQVLEHMKLDPILLTTSKLILGTVVVFSVGYLLISKLSGTANSRQVHRELQSEVEQHELILEKALDRIREIEARLPNNALAMSRRGLDCLGLVRKIVNAVERRQKDVKDLLERGSRLDLIDAYDLLHRKLIIADSAYDSLIDANPIPALEPSEIIPTVIRLLEDIDAEVVRRAA